MRFETVKTEGQTNTWLYGWTDRQADGEIDQADGERQADGQMERRTERK